MAGPNKISIADLSKVLSDENLSIGRMNTNQNRESNNQSHIFSFQTIEPPSPNNLPDGSEIIVPPTAIQNQDFAVPNKMQNRAHQMANKSQDSTDANQMFTRQTAAAVKAKLAQDSVVPNRMFSTQSLAPLTAYQIRDIVAPNQVYAMQNTAPLMANQKKDSTVANQAYATQTTAAQKINPNRQTTAANQKLSSKTSKPRNLPELDEEPEPVFKTARTHLHRKNKSRPSHYHPSGTYRQENGNYLYLKIIDCTSFLLWIISRIFRCKIWIFLLLPFIAYLLTGMLSAEASSYIQSSMRDIFFSVANILSDLFDYDEDMHIEDISDETSCTEKFLFAMQLLWFTIFNFLANLSNRAYTSLSKVPVVSKTSTLVESSIREFLIANVLPKRDDLKSIASEIVEEKFSLILKRFKAAQLKYGMFDGDQTNMRGIGNDSVDRLDEWLRHELEDYKKQSYLELSRSFQRHHTDFKQEKNMKKTVEKAVKEYLEGNGANSSILMKNDSSDSSCSSNLIRKLVNEALLIYDADKTGLVDYALESAGGSIISTRCSESYLEKGNQYSLFGISLSTDPYTSPRKAIQPSMQPGQCWAFKGSQGFLVIKLAYTIYPTGFSMEHIPVSLSPSGSIDSAPQNFSVWGLKSENDENGKTLGTYEYSLKGLPLQYFPIQNTSDKPFPMIELKIHSNHGNVEYTCLYRFRVHGNRESGRKN